MRTVPISAYALAQRFVGMKEVPGELNNPAILAMLKIDQDWPEGDSVPWCSAFINYVCWLLRLPRSKSLRARSWLQVGTPIRITDAEPGFDVVIFSRGMGIQPGPDTINAPGHVGFFAGIESARVLTLGGNQGDEVCIRGYPLLDLLGIRRLI